MAVRYILPGADRLRSTRLRVHGKVARELGMAIVAGRYRPGELLHGEIEASERFRVSRTAYREAIRILAAKGLVEARPKVGTKVSARSGWHLMDPDVLQWIFEVEPDQELIDQLFELRRIVEPEAAALAAARRMPDELIAMTEALARMARHGLATEEGQIADQDFHAQLLAASGNAFLASLTNGVSAAISLTTLSKQRVTSRYRDPIPDHQSVLDAITASDADASRLAMAALIDNARSDAQAVLRRADQRERVTTA